MRLPRYKLSRWAQREYAYARVGLELGTVAADASSRVRLAVLGATVLFKNRLGLSNRCHRVGVTLRGRTFSNWLGGRTDLEVLREIALDDE